MSASMVEGYLSQARSTVREAEETDYIMPVWLPLLPTLLAVIAAIYTVAVFMTPGARGAEGLEEPAEAAALAALTVPLLLLLAAALVGVYVLYRLIDRRNKHFMRTHRLYRNIVGLLETLGISDPELVSIRNTVQEMEAEEQPRNPILWIILTILLDIVVLYVYHFLNKDFHRHERREMLIYDNLARILEKRNIPAPRLRNTVPDRSTVLYIVLSIITLGLFSLYWVYTLAKDPNEHFMEHRRVEPELVRALESLAKTAAP